MMRSLSSGVSGLQAQQTAMDVIGNNIANVNTAGFKTSQVNFQDILYQTIQGATAPQGTTGGVNPMQVGLGTKVASIVSVFTPGSLQSTGLNTDLAINNDGFFQVSNGNDMLYTRAGAFNFDEVGNLVDSGTGYQVMGWLRNPVTGDIDTNAPTTAITIPKGVTMAPKVSTEQTLTGNLSAKDNLGDSTQTSGEVYDSLGNSHMVYTTYYKQSATPGGPTTWLADVNVPDQPSAEKVYLLTFDSSGKFTSSQDVTNAKAAATPPATTGLTVPSFQMDATNKQTQDYSVWDDNGKMHVLQYTFTPSTAGNTADGATWTYTVSDKTDSTSSLTGGSIKWNAPVAGPPAVAGYYSGLPASVQPNNFGTAVPFTFTAAGQTAPVTGAFVATSDLSEYTTATTSTGISMTPTGASSMTVAFDFTGITGYQTTDNAIPPTTNGYASGTLTETKFDSTGTIVGSFDNGMSMNLGQVALATFNNPSGLDKVGNTMFAVSNNSGAANVGTANTGGRGSISASELEASNVDLAQEFSNMIITERAFQANSKIITTSDEMLQTLTDLKR
ncbi:MAG: flagellar hook protein FlgE [Negativicutes bacterium]|nr:flagellar hook protein FlgE [Negativicutes bacterium]